MVLSTATLQQCSIQSQDAGSWKEQRQEKCFYVLNITLIDNNKIMDCKQSPIFPQGHQDFILSTSLMGDLLILMVVLDLDDLTEK